MRDLKLSIIVPMYNAEKYIDKCIDSIVHQTYKNKEIILVDDGSTDDTGAICEKIVKNSDVNIRYIKKENGGAISARRFGLELATGDYVCFADSDDWVDCDYYSDLMQSAITDMADMVIGDNCAEYPNRTVFIKQGFAYGVYDSKRLTMEVFPNMAFMSWGKLGFSPSQCTKVVRKEIMENYQLSVPDCIHSGDDAVIIYPSLLDSNIVSYVKSDALYHYRIHSESMTHHGKNVDVSEKITLLRCLDERFDTDNRPVAKRQLSLYSLYVIYSLINKLVAEGKKLRDIRAVNELIKATNNWECIGKFITEEKIPENVKRVVAFIQKPSAYNYFVMVCGWKARNLMAQSKKLVKRILPGIL